MDVDQESADKSAAAAARADEMPIDAKFIVSISMIILRKLLAQKVLCFSMDYPPIARRRSELFETHKA